MASAEQTALTASCYISVDTRLRLANNATQQVKKIPFSAANQPILPATFMMWSVQVLCDAQDFIQLSDVSVNI